MYRSLFKRSIDVFASILTLCILSPVMLVIAILIKLFDPGPIIFSQNRVGRNGQLFKFYKFRSMPVNTGDIPSDQVGSVRLTWVGRFIRRSNLDELPQLANILLGDMSLIGPRPSIASQGGLIELRRNNGALSLRPGLTGLAQVNSFDGMPEDEKARYDGEYASSVTFVGDVMIVLKTFLYLAKPPPKY